MFCGVFCLPELLAGRLKLMTFGDTSVEVIMKKISNRNTKSDIDDILGSIFLEL